jgi:hypothetical protein
MPDEKDRLVALAGLQRLGDLRDALSRRGAFRGTHVGQHDRGDELAHPLDERERLRRDRGRSGQRVTELFGKSRCRHRTIRRGHRRRRYTRPRALCGRQSRGSGASMQKLGLPLLCEKG